MSLLLALASGTPSVTRAASDALTFSDSAVRLVTEVRSGVDTLAFSDSAVCLVTEVRTASDSLALSDSAERLVGKVGVGVDTLTFSDSAVRLVTEVRIGVDNLTFSDAATRLITEVRTGVDSASFSDSAVRTVVPSGATVSRAAVDTVAFSDSAVRLISPPVVGGGSQAWLRTWLQETYAREWAPKLPPVVEVPSAPQPEPVALARANVPSSTVHEAPPVLTKREQQPQLQQRVDAVTELLSRLRTPTMQMPQEVKQALRQREAAAFTKEDEETVLTVAMVLNL
jgi:hypothetical protein